MQSTDYYNLILKKLNQIEETQQRAFLLAANTIKSSLETNGMIHVFSTGHSHMMVEDMFYRAGGLVPVDPVFDAGTMLHHGAVKSTQFERLPGYARVVFSSINYTPGDPFIIISNSGVNPVPVEMAMLAKAMNLPVIAITSTQISSQSPSRLPCGEKLMDVADIVLDSCIEDNDAAIEMEPGGQRVCSQSTVVVAYILQRLILEVAIAYRQEGKNPPIFASVNLPGGEEWNRPLLEKYGPKIKAL